LFLDTLSLTPIPPEDEALRMPVRAFLDAALAGVPTEVRARSWSGFDADFSRALGERGWIGLTLPIEHGGGGRSVFARFVLVEELLRAGAPVAAHWIADRQSAPQILRFGTIEQARRFLPRICRGEVYFCIGMSEPNAGSDLASVRTRATRTASGWRLDGQKIWTTNAHRAHFMLALARTSGDATSRHRASRSSSSTSPCPASPSARSRPERRRPISARSFRRRELGADALLGEEGDGWKQVTSELALRALGPRTHLREPDPARRVARMAAGAGATLRSARWPWQGASLP
jgi:acyl-CoA dehydrogenase